MMELRRRTYWVLRQALEAACQAVASEDLEDAWDMLLPEDSVEVYVVVDRDAGAARLSVDQGRARFVGWMDHRHGPRGPVYPDRWTRADPCRPDVRAPEDAIDAVRGGRAL